MKTIVAFSRGSGVSHTARRQRQTPELRRKPEPAQEILPLPPAKEREIYENLRNRIDLSAEKRFEKYGVKEIITALEKDFPPEHLLLKNAKNFLADLESGGAKAYQARFAQEGKVFLPILQNSPPGNPYIHLKIGVLEKAAEGARLRVYDGANPQMQASELSPPVAYPIEHPVRRGAEAALMKAVTAKDKNCDIYSGSAFTGTIPEYLRPFLATEASRPLFHRTFPAQKADDCFFHAPLFALLRESV